MSLLLLAACGVKQPMVYQVYDDDTRVLTFTEGSGPLLSTASLPPGVEPRIHPFLSGQAHSALHEQQLHTTLTASEDVPTFVALLEADGLRVERERPQR